MFLVLILLGARWLIDHRPPPAETGANVPEVNDPVMLVVNGEEVRESEFAAAVDSLPPQMQEQMQTDVARKQLAEETRHRLAARKINIFVCKAQA